MKLPTILCKIFHYRKIRRVQKKITDKDVARVLQFNHIEIMMCSECRHIHKILTQLPRTADIVESILFEEAVESIQTHNEG